MYENIELQVFDLKKVTKYEDAPQSKWKKNIIIQWHQSRLIARAYGAVEQGPNIKIF